MRVRRGGRFLVFRCRRRVLRFPGLQVSAARQGRLASRQTRATSANGTPQISKRSRAGDWLTAQLGRSTFRLTREGKVFEGGYAHVVGTRGQKWVKGRSLASGLVWKVHGSYRPAAGQHGNSARWVEEWKRLSLLIQHVSSRDISFFPAAKHDPRISNCKRENLGKRYPTKRELFRGAN
jgi:hypothetical protein